MAAALAVVTALDSAVVAAAVYAALAAAVNYCGCCLGYFDRFGYWCCDSCCVDYFGCYCELLWPYDVSTA